MGCHSVGLRPQVPPMYRGDIYGVIFRVDSISEVKMTIKPSFEGVRTASSRLLDKIRETVTVLARASPHSPPSGSRPTWTPIAGDSHDHHAVWRLYSAARRPLEVSAHVVQGSHVAPNPCMFLCACLTETSVDSREYPRGSRFKPSLCFWVPQVHARVVHV